MLLLATMLAMASQMKKKSFPTSTVTKAQGATAFRVFAASQVETNKINCTISIKEKLVSKYKFPTSCHNVRVTSTHQHTASDR